MDFSGVLTAMVTLFVLALLIVACGGVVPKQYQTMPVILGFSVGIPLFFVLMSGFVGIFLG